MRAPKNSFKYLIGAIAAFTPLMILALIVFLTYNAWPALSFNGFHFLFQNDWNIGSQYGTPVMVNGHEVLPGANFGIFFLLFGTIVSSLVALALAVPIGMGAAIFLSDAVPPSLRQPASLLVELLASIPSVVFGLWGTVVLIPFMAHHVYPVMAKIFGFIPFLAGPTRSGYGLMSSAIVLMLMIVPLITANLREAIALTPKELRESGLALGATRFEVMRKVILPRLRLPLIGVSTLALGRALGETMAVLMVSGNALGYITDNIYGPISTMAAFIVSQLDSSLQDPSGMAVNSLIEIGLILLILSLIVNGIARLLMPSRAASVG